MCIGIVRIEKEMLNMYVNYVSKNNNTIILVFASI